MRLGSVLMRAFNIYVPLIIGLLMIVIIIILVLCMDETPMQDGEDSNLHSHLNLKDRFWKIFDCLRISWSVRLLVVTFLVSSTFAQLTDGSVFQQYISKHFSRTIAKVRKMSRPRTWKSSANSETKGFRTSGRQHIFKFNISYSMGHRVCKSLWISSSR